MNRRHDAAPLRSINTVWRVMIETAPSRAGVAQLGGKASALIRSNDQPQVRRLRFPDLTDRVPMSSNPIIVRTVPQLRRAIEGLRARKATTALVPTMGALH